MPLFNFDKGVFVPFHVLTSVQRLVIWAKGRICDNGKIKGNETTKLMFYDAISH